MPVLKRRSDHVKVFRPNGTRYAAASHENREAATRQAMGAFILEFGAAPRQDRIVYEIVGAIGMWHVTLFEVRE